MIRRAVVFRMEKCHGCGRLQIVIAQVAKFGGNPDGIPIAQKAGDEGLYHDIFLGNGLIFQDSGFKIDGMSESYEFPPSQGFRDLKADAGDSGGIDFHLRKEESGFLQVFS